MWTSQASVLSITSYNGEWAFYMGLLINSVRPTTTAFWEMRSVTIRVSLWPSHCRVALSETLHIIPGNSIHILVYTQNDAKCFIEIQVIHGPGDLPRAPGKHILGLLSASYILNPSIPPLLLVDINTWQHFFSKYNPPAPAQSPPASEFTGQLRVNIILYSWKIYSRLLESSRAIFLKTCKAGQLQMSTGSFCRVPFQLLPWKASSLLVPAKSICRHGCLDLGVDPVTTACHLWVIRGHGSLARAPVSSVVLFGHHLPPNTCWESFQETTRQGCSPAENIGERPCGHPDHNRAIGRHH